MGDLEKKSTRMEFRIGIRQENVNGGGSQLPNATVLRSTRSGFGRTRSGRRGVTSASLVPGANF